MVMERISGDDLSVRWNRLLDRTLAERIVVSRQLMWDVIFALQLLHEAGLFHGDVSAANVVYDADHDRFVLVDFGKTGSEQMLNLSQSS